MNQLEENMNMQVRKKIYELRKSKDMTQEELASTMGVSIAAVSKWETGNSLPDILMLCSIADFFEVSTDELLGREKSKKKAIVVDDSAFIRDTLKKILSENGYEVIGEAEEGIELLNILKTKKADLIMLDVNMPGMGGMETLEHIRNYYPNIKVIMCTAVTDKDVVDSAIALGASGYVPKPFLPETIVASISRLREITSNNISV
jgi:two-component system chemotaxis response regulator CheY